MSFLGPDARAALDRLHALESEQGATSAAALDRLSAIRALQTALDVEPAQLAAVREAREAGAGWDEIAAAASLTPNAAKWRWQGSDAEIAERHAAGRKRAARPSSKPTDLPGLSVAEAARMLGVTAQAIYLRVSRGQLRAETVTLEDGRSYKRVFLDDAVAEDPDPES